MFVSMPTNTHLHTLKTLPAYLYRKFTKTAMPALWRSEDIKVHYQMSGTDVTFYGDYMSRKKE